MTPALLRYVIVAVGLGLLPAPVEAFSQERDCPVPERFYAFEPPLTKTAKALAGGREVRHRRARRGLHRGPRGGRA